MNYVRTDKAKSTSADLEAADCSIGEVKSRTRCSLETLFIAMEEEGCIAAKSTPAAQVVNDRSIAVP
eukprot:2559853-Rhodomonas_salina.1